MRTHRTLTTLALALFVAAGVAVAAEKLTSGPQVGKDLAGPFHPLNINGEAAGKKSCLYCSNGSNPVAMIFAREVSEPLTMLVKKIEAACDKHSDCKLGSFVVFCNDDEKLEKQLQGVAKDCKLKNVILSIDNPAGPKGYDVSRDADVTVVLYLDRNVKANYAFKKGEMKDKDVEAIIADLSKITKK